MERPRLVGLLLRAGPAAALALSPRTTVRVAGQSLELEPLFVNARKRALALGAAAPPVWLRAEPSGSAVGADAWELAHVVASGDPAGLGLGAGPTDLFVEPDLEQQFLAFPPGRTALGARAGNGEPDPQDADFPLGPGFAWHLADAYSGLASARRLASIASAQPVRIAHLDTGYDPAHGTLPVGLIRDLQYDFVDGDRDAADPGVPGVLRNPGHGTGTLGILAGNRVPPLNDFLGGAPFAEVIPLRIATSVVLLRTSALARALDYVIAPTGGGESPDLLPPVDVVSLSMGGLASEAWAAAVNHAYEAGITIVAAAGNNVSCGAFGLPTRLIVYPARFHRVIAACGVMANGKPYFGLHAGAMQGNWGPASKMTSAIAAFTPNMPWAEMGAAGVVDMNGCGTSSATPQVAAAAALWIAEHRAELAAYSSPWQRVAAVRHALFSSAARSPIADDQARLGNGTLRAAAALAISPPAQPAWTPPDSARLALLNLLYGLRAQAPGPREAMLALEAAQLVQQWDGDLPNPFEALIPDPDLPPSTVASTDARRFFEALIEHPRASRPLRDELERAYVQAFGDKTSARAPSARPAPRATVAERAAPASSVPVPVHRRLRVYAFDPSVQQRLDTTPVGIVTCHVPWEPLERGPAGEYLEVVDYDPASECVYEPVDLDAPALLAQDGLPPAEGTPQFHQQMVYAVTSLTIDYFERALGRKALWAPGPPPDAADVKDDSHFVPRLRIYPHAFRGANAYYSPPKKALLFGYYTASDDDPAGHMPGSMVFTCLSHDIVAHETAHALLDGMHRNFTRPTNLDMLAFHEAFADVVALFQHFTFPEVIRHQIASTRGDIRSHENLLGQLAVQFGRTTGLRGALRDYIGRFDRATGAWRPYQSGPSDYEQATEPHTRGAVLVSAIFDAFLSIYERRTRDLLRLATGGSGVVPPGAALHPDLVNRLASEAAKTADHVLGIAIRALDYCPPVDLTFGEYLRALVTADRDLVPDDDLGYRVAFVEAFRRRGIYPRSLRTLSVESLLWRGPQDEELQPSDALVHALDWLRSFAFEHVYAESRHELFKLARRMRARMHSRLQQHFEGKTGAQDAAYLGLDLERNPSFEVHAGRIAHRIGPDGQLLPQFVMEIVQEEKLAPGPGSGRTEPATFPSGCTLVADLRTLRINYCIRKPAASDTRRERQLAFETDFAGRLPGATYFGNPGLSPEPFARLHLASGGRP